MTAARTATTRSLAALFCALLGLAPGCGSGKNDSTPGGKVPPPQPTTGKTGTPSTPSNTARTTTAATR